MGYRVRKILLTLPREVYDKLWEVRRKIGASSWEEVVAHLVSAFEGKEVKPAPDLEERVRRLEEEIEEIKEWLGRAFEGERKPPSRKPKPPSPKQLNYIAVLFKRLDPDLQEYILDRYGARNLEELLAKIEYSSDASSLIDEIQELLAVSTPGEGVEEGLYTKTRVKEALKEEFGIEDVHEQSLVETILKMPRVGDGNSVRLEELRKVLRDYGYDPDEELERLESLGIGRVCGDVFTLSEEVMKLGGASTS